MTLKQSKYEERCPHCQGTGRNATTGYSCGRCEGKGWVPIATEARR